MPNEGSGLPLGILRQACMKLESFSTDIREILEQEELDPADKQDFETMVELSNRMLATIVNMVNKEMGEEEFLSEQPEMDVIGEWPNLYPDEAPPLEDEIIDEE